MAVIWVQIDYSNGFDKMFFLIKRKSTVWNTPTQHSMDLGLFEIKQSSIQHDNGHILISRTPKVTVKGQ